MRKHQLVVQTGKKVGLCFTESHLPQKFNRLMNQTWIDFCEDIADDRAEDQQNSNYNDSNQNKD